MNEHQFSRLLPVKEWRNYHRWPTENALRHYIKRSHTNGFEAVIRRIGRRVLIDEQAFFHWVNAKGGTGDTPGVARSIDRSARNYRK